MGPLNVNRVESFPFLQKRKVKGTHIALKALQHSRSDPTLSPQRVKVLTPKDYTRIPSPYRKAKPPESEAVKRAKKDAAANGWLISARIQDYGIDNQKDLVDIAKIAARQDGGGVSAYIENYGITSEDDRIEIALLAAMHNGIADADEESTVSAFIGNYRIKNQKGLVKIAMAAAKHNGLRTAQHFRNYRIKDSNDREIIFRETLKNNSNAIRFANQFDLELKTLAKISSDLLKKHPLLASLVFDTFNNKPVMLLKIQAELYKNFPRLAKQLSQKKSMISEEALRNFSLKDTLSILDNRDFSKREFKNLMAVIDKVKESQNPHENTLWLITALITLDKLDHSILKYLLKKNVLLKMADLKPRSYRSMLVDDIAMFSNANKEWLSIYQDLNRKSGRGIHRLIPNLYLAHFLCQGFDKEAVEDLAISIGKNNHLRKHKFQSVFYPFFHKLMNNQTLHTFDREYILNLLFVEEESIKQNVYILDIILSHGEGSMLTSDLAKTNGNFSKLLNRFFQSEGKVKSLKHFADRFNDVIGFQNVSGKAFLSLWVSLSDLPEARRVQAFHQLGLYLDGALCRKTQKVRKKNTLHKIKNMSQWEQPLPRGISGDLTALETDKSKTMLEGLAFMSSLDRVEVNEALLSVLTDAKNRMIVVKDKKGQIQGAAVMKLLFEKKSQKPLIFLDKIYPVRPSRGISEMILETAKKKSNIMGFDLYQKSEGRKTDAPTLLSLGSASYSEYCDGAGGIIKWRLLYN